MLLQIIITILVILILSVIVNKKSQSKISLSQAVIWTILWLIILLVFWYPELASYLATALGIGRGADLIIYLAVLAIFYMIFRMYLRLDKFNSDLTKVVRQVGLDQANKKDIQQPNSQL